MYISPKKIMAAQYKLEPDGSISITLNIKPQGSMLEQEEQIAEAVAGRSGQRDVPVAYPLRGSPADGAKIHHF